MKNLLITIQFVFLISLLTAQNNYDQLRYLVVFNDDIPTSIINQIKTEHQAEELWVSPYSSVRYWKSPGYPHYVNNDLISDIKEEVKKLTGRAEVTGSGLNYDVVNFGEPLGYSGPELSPCYLSFQPSSNASHNSTIVSILDTGLKPFGTYPPEFTFEYGNYTGYNYIDGVPDMQDDNGHGTHIAGIISHVSQHLDLNGLNGLNISDIKFDIRKVFDEQGHGSISDIVYAFDDAVLLGAKVINMSFAYYGEKSVNKPDPLEHSILKAAQDEVLVVCAAGNEELNNDIAQFPAYPASYTCDNILSVGSINCHSDLSTFSNFGEQSVDVTFLGEFVHGPSPQGDLVSKSGTSQATAVVSGIATAATTYLTFPDYNKVKCAILNTAKYSQSLQGYVLSSGVADALNAATISALQSCEYNGHVDFRSNTSISEDQLDWKISPNPMNNNGILNINSTIAGSYNLQIFNMDGKLNMSTNVKCKVGENAIYMDDLSSLNSGTYIIKISNENISECKKLIKM